jgi:hypothetical protein
MKECNDIIDMIEAKRRWQMETQYRPSFIYLTRGILNVLKKNLDAFKYVFGEINEVFGLRVMNVDNYKQISFSKSDIFISEDYLFCNIDSLSFKMDIPKSYLISVRKINYDI